jgi:excisionase family DNA binding protein
VTVSIHDEVGQEATPPPSDLTFSDPPEQRAPLIYDVPTAAKIIDRSERFTWNLIKSGELRHVRQGRSVGVRDDDLAAYIEAHTLTGQ